MSTGKDLNLALRITADLNEAKSAVGSLTGDINEASAAARTGNTQWSAMVASQDAAASAARQHSQTQAALAGELAHVSTTAQQTSSSASNYQNSVSQAHMASEALKSSTSDVNADLNAQQAALSALLGRIDPVVGAYERLDDMERQLSEFNASGLIGGDDLELYTSRLNEMRNQVEKNAYAASEAGRKEALAARESAQAAREAAQVEAQARATKETFIARLREQAETMNMTTAELLEYKAAQLGVTDEAAPFIQRLNDQSAAMNKGGLSAAQYNQALRYLPMQITDVVTSLASGMPVWMVAIQQGGQIKDSFGGMGNTFRALSGLITPARLAMGGMAASVAAAGAAAISVINDQEMLGRAIAQTGTYAGVTAGQLEMMAKNGGSLRSNYSQVRDILGGLVSSGKFTAETLESVSQAASAMAQLTGQSADQVVSEFVKMTDSVSTWAVNSNEKYHWLDSATYLRIQALEEQGKTEEAIELASDTYNKAATTRLKQLETDLNWVASGWKGIKDRMSEAIEAAKGGMSTVLGLDSESEARVKRIKDLQERLAFVDRDPLANIWGDDRKQYVQGLREELAGLEKKEAAVKAAAAAETERQKIEEKGQKTFDSIKPVWFRNASDIDKEAMALDKLKKQYQDMWKVEALREGTPDDPGLRGRGVVSEDGMNFSGGQWDIDVAALDTANKKAQQYNDTLRQTIEQKSALTQLDKVEAEIRNGSLSDATAEMQEQARQLARQADAQDAQIKAARAAAAETKRSATENQRFVNTLVEQATKQTQSVAATRAQEIATRNLTTEQRKMAEAAHAALNAREFSDKNLQLQMAYMRASGNSAGASLLEVRNQYQQMRAEFTSSGNTEGLNWLDKLLPMQEAKIRADELKKEMEDLFTWRSQQETSIQAQVQGGLLTETQGRRQLIELHQQVGEKIEKYLPKLKEMAAIPGEAGEKIRELLRQLEEELNKTKRVGNELTEAFRDGLQSGIESSLMGLAKGTMTLNDALKNMVLTIINSMAQLASQELAKMATSSLIGSSGGAGGLIGSLGSLFAADGGHVRGPGTTTSDSIPAMLSDYEYVTRAAVVKQPGALPFLHDFNQRGIAALEDWAPRVRHATGGLAGIPAPAFNMPATIPEPSQRPSTTDSDGAGIPFQQTLVLDSGELISSGFKSLRGKREFFTFVQANAPTLKQMLGVKT